MNRSPVPLANINDPNPQILRSVLSLNGEPHRTSPYSTNTSFPTHSYDICRERQLQNDGKNQLILDFFDTYF